jgi:hypothetical protein
MSGKRYNKEKPRADLLPWDALIALADHYGKSAKKYPARNWELGLKWNEGCAASLARHLAAWSSGEDYEVELWEGESGATHELKNYHDVAMAWNALALVAYRLRQIGEDDRPKLSKQEPPQTGSCLILGRQLD